MKYTFLLPAYKTGFLEKAINSILSQTYKDFQLIISDDCSPEDIKSIVDRFEDNRIIYRRNSSNIGAKDLVEHWNLLVNLTKSDYLIMASDDDLYDNMFLEEIDALTIKYPFVNILRSRVKRINKDSKTTAKDDLYPEFQTELDALYSMYNSNYIGCIANYVFKTKPLKDIGGFVNLPYAWFSDAATVISMLKDGLSNTKDILFSFRLSQINISDTTNNKTLEKGKLEATLHFDKWMSDYISKIKIEDTVLNFNRLNIIIHNYKHIVYSHCGDYSWAISIIKLIDVYNKLKRNIYFSKFAFLKSYCLAMLARKIGKYL